MRRDRYDGVEPKLMPSFASPEGPRRIRPAGDPPKFALLWEVRGPVGTGVKWISCYSVNFERAVIEDMVDGEQHIYHAPQVWTSEQAITYSKERRR